ncbi:MAG: hypothetical protein NPINA01_22080 [Nitrospinaceae bacterium]|nr:MAG: hypothetical protein NPINA01_22080 [Nitrospinaceae bacterium]
MPVHFTHLDTGKIDTTESFFSDQFLKSRINSGQESNQGFDPIFDEERDEKWQDQNWKEVKSNEMKYDEDVNQYITLALADLVNPKSLEFTNQYTVGIDSDVGQIPLHPEENFKKYFLYKVNADFLLFTLGLFHRDSNILGAAYFDKGESYYFSAASHLKGVKGGRSGMSDVLEKLSLGFGKYVEILRNMKNSADNFLSFNFKFSKQEMQNLQETLSSEVRKKKDSGSD